MSIGLVQLEGAGEIVDHRLHAASEDGRVLERHARPLAHVRLHGMTGVAEKHDTPGAPERKRVAHEQRPLADVRRRRDDALHLFVKPGVVVVNVLDRDVDRRGAFPVRVR